MNLINTTIADVTYIFDGDHNETNGTDLTTSSMSEYYVYPPDYFDFLEELRFKIASFLWQRLSIIFAFLSATGNCFIIAVLSRRKDKYFSTSLFIISLALADLFVSGYLIEGFLGSNGFILGAYNNFDCKFRDFLPVLGHDASPLTLTLISIERAVSVVFPHKVKTIFTRRVAIFLVLLVWSISLATTCLHAYVYEFGITRFGDYICGIHIIKMKVHFRIKTITNQVLKYGTWIINVVCMVIITRTLIKKTVVKDKSVKTPIKSVTLTLLTVNIVYFLFMTPLIVYDSYIDITLDRFFTYVESQNHYNVQNFLQFFSNMNNVLNFYIYFMIGSRFRKESKELLLSFRIFRLCCRDKE